MRPRTLLLLALMAVLGAAVAVLPALAVSSAQTLEVNENCDGFSDWPCWTAPGTTPTYERSITISTGGTITFKDMTGTPASITWSAGAPSCSAGVPVDTTAKTGWEGTCTFEQAGTYSFESSTMYPTYRSYEVVVQSSGTSSSTLTGSGGGHEVPTSPTPSSPQSPGAGSPGSPTGSATPPGPLFVGSPSKAVELASHQRGHHVDGSVDVSRAGAGGRLEVQLLALRASLAGAGKGVRLPVGRLVLSPLHTGTETFSVPLDARALHVLHSHHQLALTVRLALVPSKGPAVTVTRGVTLNS